MTPLTEVIQEKIALIVIISFFTFLGLEIARSDGEFFIVVLAKALVFMSVTFELLVFAWLILSIKKWRGQRQNLVSK